MCVCVCVCVCACVCERESMCVSPLAFSCGAQIPNWLVWLVESEE